MNFARGSISFARLVLYVFLPPLFGVFPLIAAVGLVLLFVGGALNLIKTVFLVNGYILTNFFGLFGSSWLILGRLAKFI